MEEKTNISEFYLKRDTRFDGTPRARVFVRQSNGFVGVAGDEHTKAAPVLRAKFDSGLNAFGFEKARDICLKDGEFHLPVEPRRPKVVERELAEVLAKAEALRAELGATGGTGVDSEGEELVPTDRLPAEGVTPLIGDGEQ